MACRSSPERRCKSAVRVHETPGGGPLRLATGSGPLWLCWRGSPFAIHIKVESTQSGPPRSTVSCRAALSGSASSGADLGQEREQIEIMGVELDLLAFDLHDRAGGYLD